MSQVSSHLSHKIQQPEEPALPTTGNGGKHVRRRTRLVVLSILACVLALGAFFAALSFFPAPRPAPTGLAVGSAAPTFVLPIYGGDGHGTIALRALRWHPVVINFWSESCPPCLIEMPMLQRTYLRGQGKFLLLGVDQADPQDDIGPFGRQHQITYPLLFDRGGAVNTAYHVTAIPTTYFVDRQGIIRAVFVTQLTERTLRQGLATIGVTLT